jgi:PLP dependent protein
VSEIDTHPQPATLAERFALTKSRIESAAKIAGRSSSGIVLVAVTKYAAPEQIREVIALGQRDLAENKVQQLQQRLGMLEEWQARARMLPSLAKEIAGGSVSGGVASGGGVGAVRWHMIGHLQRNKVKKVLDQVRLIHSVDSLRLAEEIQAAAAKREEPAEVLVQVNCSGEESKYGCPLAAAVHIVEQIETMVMVRVRGLMTMAPDVREGSAKGGEADVRRTFSRCRELFEEIRRQNPGDGRFNILSMGMSHDFELAIEEGANLVRVGSAIFGPPAPGTGDEPGHGDGEPEADGEQ